MDNLLLAVFLLAWVLGGGWREKFSAIRRHPVTPVVLALCGIVLLGCLYGPSDNAETLRFLRKYANLLLILLLLPLFRDPRDRLRALAAFGAAMGLTLLLSLLLWRGLLPDGLLAERLAENPVVFKLHITHGIFMALASFLAAVAALHLDPAQRRWRLLLAGAALLAAFNVLFMIEGRTGQLALTCLLGYFFIDRFRWRGMLLATAGLVVVVAIAYQLQAPLIERFALAAGEYRQWTGVGANKTSIGARLDFYINTLSIIREHPFFGVGTGGFTAAYAAVVAGTGQVAWNNPHNQYLLTAAQYGIVGLGMLLWMFYAIWRSAGSLPKPWQLAARGLLLVMMVGNLFNSFLLDHAESLLFVWMTGVLLAGCPPRAARTEPT
ncbi:O-antigen ligase family protein [Sterolibacterium denitrificans]|uniref:O-antigen ligase family protein n=1 Tax=Sterolibacterium denitrificans TaxID=157592 RepID=UPI001561FD18|nr:O-antigen ligase family protein [Sterolibacterium denitrificans]